MPLTRFGWYRSWCNRPEPQHYFGFYLLLTLVLVGCKTDYQKLPAYSQQKQLQVVVQTPAGSNRPQQYDARNQEFVPVQDAGIAAHIPFLPYPGNWGFIPATAYRHVNAGDPKPLEILVLSESKPSGTVQEVIPIATLLLDVAGELTPIPIAVPARPSERNINATDFNTFTDEFPAAKEIIQQWFLHHNAHKKTRLVGWKDEKYTEQFIRRYLQ